MSVPVIVYICSLRRSCLNVTDYLNTSLRAMCAVTAHIAEWDTMCHYVNKRLQTVASLL